jgi:hypothetical protein
MKLETLLRVVVRKAASTIREQRPDAQVSLASGA